MGIGRPHPYSYWGGLGHTLSLFTWAWLYPLLSLTRGQKGNISADDVWDLPASDRSSALLARYLARRERYPNESLPRTLFGIFWRRWALAGGLYIIWAFAAGCQPFLVAAIVRHLEAAEGPQPPDKGDGYRLGTALFFATLLYSSSINHKFHQREYILTDPLIP